MSLAWALLAWASLAAAPSEGTVRVRLLERVHPSVLQLSGPTGSHRLEARGTSLLLDGLEVAQPSVWPEAEWHLQLPSAAVRRYSGALLVRAVQGELALVLVLPLERYVAGVVASETVPGTPREALRAQAVVVRSYVLAQGPRHADADVCDLAHCQVFRSGGVASRHRTEAEAATLATAGRALVLASGAVAEAPFHAACGGHTADPEEVFGSATTGATAVEDTGCPAQPWEAVVPLARFRAALGPLFSTGPQGTAPAADMAPLQLELVRGQGGYVRSVLAMEGRSARGGSVARALDRALGWGAVRSGRFDLSLSAETVRVRGTGLGHGLGLCQAGAALRAARGEGYQAILQHYFPLASLRKRSFGVKAAPAGALETSTATTGAREAASSGNSPP